MEQENNLSMEADTLISQVQSGRGDFLLKIIQKYPLF
jgi:hypothetical protein